MYTPYTPSFYSFNYRSSHLNEIISQIKAHFLNTVTLFLFRLKSISLEI